MNIRILILVSTLTLLLPGLSLAAFDSFLKIEGIPGESTNEKHADEIVVTSFSTGFMQPQSAAGHATGGGGGKTVLRDLSITKLLDRATPLLMLKCAQGTRLPTAVLTVLSPGERSFEDYKITMNDVVISSVSTVGSSTGDRPTETVTLNFKKIEWEYTPQKADGSPGTPVKGSWDLTTNSP
jgi:type VI secretion system secreted protein Hcp